MPKSNTRMRAKLQVGAVLPLFDHEKNKVGEMLHMHGVARAQGYADTDGADEDNTFARYSPSAALQIHIANPALFDTFEPGQKFYVDFSPAA